MLGEPCIGIAISQSSTKPPVRICPAVASLLRHAVSGYGPIGIAWPQTLTAEKNYFPKLAQDLPGLIKSGISKAPHFSFGLRPAQIDELLLGQK
jgi:hypothetical protein